MTTETLDTAAGTPAAALSAALATTAGPEAAPDAGPTVHDAGATSAVPGRTFSFRPVDAGADAQTLQRWIATEHARFWGMPDATPEEVRAEYARLGGSPHHHALIAETETGPAFLLEVYDPRHSQLAGQYAWRPGDAGLHLLLPEPEGAPVPGFSQAAMEAAVDHVFADPAAARIVVEPDARNTAVHALNSRVGFRPAGRVDLPEHDGEPAKRALLSFLERKDFARATGRPSSIAAHLDPVRWKAAHRHVLAKALGEFAHERLLEPEHIAPEPIAPGRADSQQPDPESAVYGVRAVSDGVAHEYRFAATRHLLNHWRVDPDSLEHLADGEPAGVDAQEFVVAFREPLGLSAAQLPVYIEELGSTLASHCYKQLHSDATAAELAAGTGDAIADFQRLEAAMTEGHPCFVANNGRLGLGAQDYLEYAPETGAAASLEWVALHASRAKYSAVAGLDHRTLLRDELGAATLARFDAAVATAVAGTGLDAAEFLYLPVHPWQWEHRLAVTFAPDVATRHMVHLGSSEDLYQPQQSIRTFFNRSRPDRHYVKTALSVVNMGFLRGLSAKYMESTPAINEWLEELVGADAELHERRVELLREVAAVGYTSPLYTAATDETSAHRKMLAALWRESPVARLGDGERPATMAALLHVDGQGRSLAAALIRRSGLDAASWLECYFDAYLVPLVHCLVKYNLVFMPHGENVILVLRDGVPNRMLMKDLAEEVAVVDAGSETRVDLPEEVARIRAEVPADQHVLSIFTDVFDCFFRFLAPLLAEEGLIGEHEFWRVVGERLRAYRERNPDLAARFDELGLFADEFALSCLNRLQLRNNRQMLDLGDQAGGLIYAGTLKNPITG
ncbi:GNAT family N-acetyltransferase [Zhihengliuella sp.]|uniref:GNAT family N-acetyltransferase n=1 Tax=Zhihengliuella sp. TaxID=1954483 RepID=UPI00281160D8|nr:GNAT family N-acetyltransferase [Zhihengliuella sp.]